MAFPQEIVEETLEEMVRTTKDLKSTANVNPDSDLTEARNSKRLQRERINRRLLYFENKENEIYELLLSFDDFVPEKNQNQNRIPTIG